MEIIKCKECEKELSKKAEICPNCGVRVKKKSIFKQLGVVFLGIIIFIIICILLTLAFYGIVKISEYNNKKMYVGTWRLSTFNRVYIPKDAKHSNVINQEELIEIFLDKELTFTKNQVYRHNGGEAICFHDENTYERCEQNIATVYLSQKKDEIAINFSDVTGGALLLCFKLENEDTLKQISCRDVVYSESTPEGFYLNGGISEELGIIYKKIK